MLLAAEYIKHAGCHDEHEEHRESVWCLMVYDHADARTIAILSTQRQIYRRLSRSIGIIHCVIIFQKQVAHNIHIIVKLPVFRVISTESINTKQTIVIMVTVACHRYVHAIYQIRLGHQFKLLVSQYHSEVAQFV